MDEIFGENNLRNEIIWCYYGPGSPGMKQFNRKHDTIFWYSKSDDYYFFDKQIRIAHDSKTLENFKKGLEGSGFVSENYDLDAKGKIPEDWWEMAVSGRFPKDGIKRVDYATEKPWELIERIIKASSSEGMLVADFFCGSGVTATVANKLGRKFITCDIGLNSVETARDRLKNNGAKFDILEVKDGVTLYRNPTQTMDNIKRVIKGLRNEDNLNKMWEGSINDSKYGHVPVYVPNLTDPTTRVLSKHLVRRIIHEAMPDLPENTKKVIVYYIDVEDLEGIKKFSATENYFPIKIDFQDLKPKLDNFIMADDARWTMAEVSEGMFKVWQITIDSFHCDRVLKKMDEYHLKTQEQMAQATDDEKKNKAFTPMALSAEGLECIEWISLDCTSAEEQDEWHSDVELKIEADSRVRYNNGDKSEDYWDGTIRTLDERKPLRMKIRNICGDETIYII